MKKRAVILAGGHAPAKKLIKQHIQTAQYFVCADGGANSAAGLGLKPDLIIGDLDSVSKKTLLKYKRVELVFDRDQETTDLEKAINYCISKGVNEALLFGVLGYRIDHSTSVLGALRRYAGKIKLVIYDDYGTLQLINKSIRFKSEKGEKISLIPLTKCRGVTTKGLLFPLRKESLELGVREGVSNQAVAKQVAVSVAHGNLIIYRWRESRTD